MNKRIIAIVASVLIIGLVAVYLVIIPPKNDESTYPVDNISEEAKEALIEAINDEYKAHALYEKTIAKLGPVRPFSMIIEAENQHISSLKSLFDKYRLQIPTDNWADKVTAEDTLKDACQAGVTAEIANAKLYREKLLPMAKGYENIQSVFTNLMNASQEKHLTAFERCN
jgi:hypothetical protein